MCFSYEYLKKKKKIGGLFGLNSLSNHKEKVNISTCYRGKKKDAETIHAIKQNILILD